MVKYFTYKAELRFKLLSLLTVVKMAAWSPLYYGELPYLLTAAAAGP